MKAITSLLSLLVFTLLMGMSNAFAVSSGAAPVRVVYSSNPILSSAYSELVASTVKGVKGVTVAQTGANPIALAFGAAGSEVQQVVVPAMSALVPVYIPLAGAYGIRISAIALSASTGTVGELQMNLIYN